MHKWKVVPLSKGQLTDIRQEDILENGHFRICETYRGGGGYDKFPYIAKELFNKDFSKQFIVQLFGCNLDCPYCYVTREGVWNSPVEYSTKNLVDIFNKYKNLNVFHLMGGAPALQIQNWPELLLYLDVYTQKDFVFHSDLMLTEKIYDLSILKKIARYNNSLFAVNIKGYDEKEWYKNTRKYWKKDLFLDNLHLVNSSNINYYITFTNVSVKNQMSFIKSNYKNLSNCKSMFDIDLIDYNAIKYVDAIPWGAS